MDFLTCYIHSLYQPGRYDFLLTDKDHRILYAMVPKVASTTWIQLQVYFSGKFTHNVEFQDIQIDRKSIEKYGLIYLHKTHPAQRKDIIQNYYSFVFGRNPFERYDPSTNLCGFYNIKVK